MSAEIVRQARDYGFHVYVGRILSIGTFDMDVLLVGAWATTEEVGYYALAVAIAGGAGLPVIALATALFARMAVEARIDRRWLILSTAVGAALSLVAYLVSRHVRGRRLLRPVPGRRPAARPAPRRAVVRRTRRSTTPTSPRTAWRELRNAGLVADRQQPGAELRALIPPYGAMGAAWASLVALVANPSSPTSSSTTARSACWSRRREARPLQASAADRARIPCCWSSTSRSRSARASTFGACAARTTRRSPACPRARRSARRPVGLASARSSRPSCARAPTGSAGRPDAAMRHGGRPLGSRWSSSAPRSTGTVDFESGHVWPPAFLPGRPVTRLDDASDAKAPWS